MKLLIDADGCPVIGIALKVAKEKDLSVLLVCDMAHSFEKYDAEVLTVSKGADSADFALVNRLSSGDVVVTQDYGLAALSLARKARPISQNGVVFTEENIDAFLMARHTAKKIRSAGGRLKGPAKRTNEQDNAFELALRTLVEEE